MINFDNYRQNDRMYGGSAGRKIGIVYENADYIIKFPGNLREHVMKNINLSYSNSPICEYIGSKIYELLDIPVHETILGKRNGKIVVACKDFMEQGDRLYEFDKIKVTFEPSFLDSNGNETNGTGVDLYEILMTIYEHPFFQGVDGVEERFWQMFIIDALIGNGDRNNTNWGIIVKADGSKQLAPVYDNGNCLNCKWDMEHIQKVLEDEKIFISEAYNGRRTIFELNGKSVNPYHLISSMEYEGCNTQVQKLIPVIEKRLPDIKNFIVSIPELESTQSIFYQKLIETRYEKVLMPTYTKLLENDIIPFKKGRSR
ncbi:CtkA family protein [Lachnospiraceae bacterium 48-33]